MHDSYRQHIAETLDSIRQAGTWKGERVIDSPQ